MLKVEKYFLGTWISDEVLEDDFLGMEPWLGGPVPLIKSGAKKAVGKNIEKEVAAGKPRKQAIAIALDVQRRAGGGAKRHA